MSAPAMTRTPANIIDTEKLELQIELEKLFNKNQLIPRIKKEFYEFAQFNFPEYIERRGIPLEFGIDVLVQMALHKRTTLPTLVGILRHHYEGMAAASQLTTNMLYKCAEADLMNWNPHTQQFVVIFTLDQRVQDELDRFQYPLPMVVQPKEVRHNSDSAYVMGTGSLILKKNHHEDDICLDHLNRVNKIRFALDHDTARMVKNQWRNLDKPKEGESKAEFQKRQKAFEKYDRTAKDVIALLGSHSSDLYLTHKYDKRGRVYCQGYHVNYQGAPWNKAVLQLAEKEHVD